MDKRDEAFLEKATKLISEYKKSKEDSHEGVWNTIFNKECKTLSDDMIHLLYSYDANLPAFAKIKLRIEQGGFAPNDDILECLEYTIHYIKEIKI